MNAIKKSGHMQGTFWNEQKNVVEKPRETCGKRCKPKLSSIHSTWL